jgi:hypothetical protein
MYWATTIFQVGADATGLKADLQAWRDHISVAHKKVREVRCYRYNGGTTVVWQEGFENFHDYQDLMEEEDDLCASVMGAVFRHEVPGTRVTRIWSDGF